MPRRKGTEEVPILGGKAFVKKRSVIEDANAREIIERQKPLILPDEDYVFGDEAEPSKNVNTEDEEGKIRRKNRKIRDVKSKIGALSWEEAVRLFTENPDTGLKKIRERRHVSLPYHQLGNISSVLRFIAESRIGKFSKEVKGVVLAVGEISDVRAVRVIDDQNCFHFDAVVEQVVFRPQRLTFYEAAVTMVTDRYVTASIFNFLSIVCPMNNADKVLRGVPLTVGDAISVRYRASEVKAAICVLKGELVKLVRRTSIHTPSFGIAKPTEVPHGSGKRKWEFKEEIKEETPTRKNKRVKFVDDDE